MSAPIGVFDSGIGGLSILRALRAAMPRENFVYIADAAHAPYGERGDAFVASRSHEITRRLVGEHGAKMVVVACNTATAAAIHLLRAEFPATPFVGIEPALKPAAAATRTGRVAVMATRTTLRSSKFAALLATVPPGVETLLQPCDGLADAIERGELARIEALCVEHTSALGPFGTEPGMTDTLVLGCTHYPLAMPSIRARTGSHVNILEPGEAVARRTRELLSAASHEGPLHEGTLTLSSTGRTEVLQAATERWLGP